MPRRGEGGEGFAPSVDPLAGDISEGEKVTETLAGFGGHSSPLSAACSAERTCHGPSQWRICGDEPGRLLLR